MYTRHQYMCKEVTHEQYYGQFVTTAIKASVKAFFGEAALLASKDPYFNDIPLRKWDAFIGYNLMYNRLLINPVFNPILKNLKETNGSGGYAPSDFTCISKQAAREIAGKSLQDG